MTGAVAGPDAPVRGCVVLAHGLNTTPAVMDELAAVLRGAGFACAPVLLHPDGAPPQGPDDVVEDWFDAFDATREQLAARHPGLPVSAVGYSLGGLIALLRATARPGTVDRLVLWAPPLALTRSAASVRLLTPGHRFGLRLRSAAPAEARARSATPLAEYAALLRLVAEAAALPREAVATTSGLVLLEGRDPLVSHRGVTRWVHTRRLPGWAVHEVHAAVAPTPQHRHLVVSEAVLGRREWRRVTGLMLDHLARPPIHDR